MSEETRRENRYGSKRRSRKSRNLDTSKSRRRNREAPLKLYRGYDVVSYQSELLSRFLSFNIHRKRATFDRCITDIYSDDSGLRAQATEILAETLETDPRLVKHLTAKDVDVIIGFLKIDTNILVMDQPIQYHAAVILTIIFSSKYLGEVIANKSLPPLVRLLGVENCDVINQALSALTKLTYNFPTSCKDILELKVLSRLKYIVTRWGNRDGKLVTDCAMLLGAICIGHPNLSTHERDEAFDIATAMLQCHIMPEACVALAKLSDGRCTRMTPRDCEILIEYIRDYPPSTIISALEVVGNVARWGNYQQNQCMIANGVMQPLERLLLHDYKILRKEACWIISNIIALNKEKDVISTELVECLCNRLDNDELDVKIEAGWAILNLSYSKSTDLRVIKKSCWATLLRQQHCQDFQIVNVCTAAIRTLSQLVTED